MIHRRPARRTGGGCERKGSGWQGGQGGRGRAATRCGGRAATHLHRGPTAGPSKSHRTLCVALEILLRQGSTGPSSASVTQNFALKQRETDGNNSASVNLRHCVSKTENVEWPLNSCVRPCRNRGGRGGVRDMRNTHMSSPNFRVRSRSLLSCTVRWTHGWTSGSFVPSSIGSVHDLEIEDDEF